MKVLLDQNRASWNHVSLWLLPMGSMREAY